MVSFPRLIYRLNKRSNSVAQSSNQENYINACSGREMNNDIRFNLSNDAIRLPYNHEVAAYCDAFSCDNVDLDDFFANVAPHYDIELLGKTYAWVRADNPKHIMGMITLANDSVKLQLISSSALNRLQRSVTNKKRGINFPAVLIGRLGVSTVDRNKGYHIGSQIIDFVKQWFRSSDNKTGCRFIVVDAYNNEKTIRFYQHNGFKMLYKTEYDERQFLELADNEPLETRFMFYDLKKI